MDRSSTPAGEREGSSQAKARAKSASCATPASRPERACPKSGPGARNHAKTEVSSIAVRRLLSLSGERPRRDASRGPARRRRHGRHGRVAGGTVGLGVGQEHERSSCLERMRDLWDDRRRSAETGRCCPEGGATPSDRPELLEHGGRLRAARALAARRVRGDPPGRAGRRAAVCGRAGAPRGRSRRRRRGQLPRPHPRSRGGARRPAADLRARRSPDERVGRSPPTTCGTPSVERRTGPRSSSSPRRATPARGSPMPARGPTTPRRRPTARPAAERSSTARPPPR